MSKISYRGATNSTETVTQIALWRYHDRLGYDTIAERLNADPIKYPPPSPPEKIRARGAWGKPSVYEISRNPKYTGCQVFNRRASRSGHGKVNEPIKWVWSAQPAHEPLIPNYTCWPKTTCPRRGAYSIRTKPFPVRTVGFCHCQCCAAPPRSSKAVTRVSANSCASLKSPVTANNAGPTRDH